MKIKGINGKFTPILKDGDLDLIKQFHDHGLNFVEIAGLMGCSFQTILRKSKEIGIPAKKATSIDPDKLVKLYITDGKSLSELAIIFGCDCCHVAYELDKLGILIRNHKKAMELAATQRKLGVQDEEHSNWRGGMKYLPYSPVVRSAHFWVRRYYGKANHCKFNNNHNSPRYHWANVSGLYQKTREDWLMLCPLCHYYFDHPDIPQESLESLKPEYQYAYWEGRRRNNAKTNPQMRFALS
jgi:hypothetical protein